MSSLYNGIIFAYGASKDRDLGLSGEHTIKGIYSARSFVGWYNGLPEYANLDINLDTERAVIIGQGNVALDVARILLAPTDELAKTDIALHALDALSRSRVKYVDIVGRRGPLQAAYTVKEVRELMQLPHVQFERDQVIQGLLDQIAAGMTLTRQQKRMFQVIGDGSSTRTPQLWWKFQHFLSPKRFAASPGAQLEAIEFEVNKLLESTSVKGTGQIESIETQLCFKSIGYKAEPLETMSMLNIAFDNQLGIIPNKHGRIVDAEGTHLPGLYASGWVKRGPTGVIAGTMMDAFETADNLASDYQNGLPFMHNEKGDTLSAEDTRLALGLRNEYIIDWMGWERIEDAERLFGAKVGKDYAKITSIDGLLHAARI